jgi:hypothetical protein
MEFFLLLELSVFSINFVNFKSSKQWLTLDHTRLPLNLLDHPMNG